ncbi:MAG: FecR domain-containing protein [Pseudomonadota bacterium]
MNRDDWQRLLEEAMDIHLRLTQLPQDTGLLAERDAFLARGPDQQRAYRHICKVWAASGPQPEPAPRARRIAPLLLLFILAAAAYHSGGTLLNYTMADLSSGRTPVEAFLASDDRVHLDAATALIDETQGPERRVRLLEGAAFFDVIRDQRPFIVSLGTLEVQAIGTAFETAHLEGAQAITVLEGVVAVRGEGPEQRLVAGDRLVVGADGEMRMDRVDPAAVAAWRDDELIVDGMTLAEVAATLDRRIPGDVVILNDALAEIRVNGRFDLTRPASALRNLAAAAGAGVISAAPIVTLISVAEEN